MKLVKKLVYLFVFLFFFTIFFAIGCNIWIVSATKKHVYDAIENVPSHMVTVVLGTSKRLVTGADNPFFHFRMQTAANLFKQGKTRHIIVSGDNNTIYYNEPIDMKKALMELGVPEYAITLDYAGFRTLDSIVRSKEIFGQEEFIIVTQEFHTYRAVFISQFYDIRAVAMAAKNLEFKESVSVRIREFFARPKAVLDLYLLHKSPKFLGEKEPLIIR
ncbi:MAG: SanA/YdcF family protein [Candidatus Cyclobacteriaceae bacterium M3_2C_046]